ncbi:alcohol dehydrogenase GroES domain protein [Trichodelitschia bisporula]|uniref:Alcohol dehydrogenase GroES domain protein n=1 Tax=Trichodelitschia bisporula TaxID=703511 RepID=A0A6G1HSM4_9PEZI|nr:alcohol dehydrogenase GroES domain protein [Trichodelitschia bisporula]
MRALVYNGPSQLALEERPKPQIEHTSDAIIKLDYTTICGTDLHILKGDVPEVTKGRILGHEGVGTIVEVGSGVTSHAVGDQVLISCISACGACTYCRRNMYSHCTTGGWVLGHTIDGTQAEYVRIPHVATSTYKVPRGVDPQALVMLSDIFPTAYEMGVLSSKVLPGSTVVIVGAGPVGLAALVTAKLYSPSWVLVVDPDENRLEVAREWGAVDACTPAEAVGKVRELTEGVGADCVIECVGIPETFEQCQELVAPGGVVANVGVHGTKADLQLQKLWASNISITMGLVDTVSTPTLLRLLGSGKLAADKMITHRFKFADMEKAYGTFGAAAKEKALKVLVEM